MEPKPGDREQPKHFDLADQLRKVGERHAEDDFAYYELGDPEAFLEKVSLAGFLLHGTSRRLAELTPQQANDTEKESGRRTAIYMTDAPAVAMFSALRGGIPLGRSQHGVSRTSDGQTIEYQSLHFAAEHPEMLAEQGYVYIFNADQADEAVGGEHLSYEPQVPIAVVEVKRSDFHYPIETIEAES